MRLQNLIFIFIIVSCGGRSSTTNLQHEDFVSLTNSSFTEDGLYVRNYDANADRVPDMNEFYYVLDENDEIIDSPQTLESVDLTHIQIVRREMDTNFDGNLDAIRYYSEHAELLRVVNDSDFDGSLDSTDYYEDDIIVRREIDNNMDGIIDEVRFFRDRSVQRIEQDTNNDGVKDYFRYFTGTNLTRIAFDHDNDGQIDEWSRYRDNS